MHNLGSITNISLNQSNQIPSNPANQASEIRNNATTELFRSISNSLNQQSNQSVDNSIPASSINSNPRAQSPCSISPRGKSSSPNQLMLNKFIDRNREIREKLAKLANVQKVTVEDDKGVKWEIILHLLKSQGIEAEINQDGALIVKISNTVQQKIFDGIIKDLVKNGFILPSEEGADTPKIFISFAFESDLNRYLKDIKAEKSSRARKRHYKHLKNILKCPIPSPGSTNSLSAADGGFVHLLEYLNKRGEDLNTRNAQKETPAHLAAKKSHNTVLQYLALQDQVDFSLTDKDGKLPLHYAAAEGNVEGVRILSKNPKLLGSRDNEGLTAVHLAAINGHSVVLEFFKSIDADLTQKSQCNCNLLHMGVVNGHMNVVQFVYEQKSLQPYLNEKSCEDRTPLQMAAHQFWQNVEGDDPDPELAFQYRNIMLYLTNKMKNSGKRLA